jgi:hypothetical protein
MQGPQLDGDDAAPRPIGKKELLQWAAEVTGLPCGKFEDLRDGTLVMKLMSSIWPRAIDPRNSRKMKATPQLDWELKRNWDTVKDVMTDLRLPVQLVDRAAIQQGRFRACYNLLVMLFFMMSLTKHREFSVDFAHPIDPRLSSFLQSNASIDALSRGGALSVQPSDTDESDERAFDNSVPESISHPAHAFNDASLDHRTPSSSSPAASAPLVAHLGFSNDHRSSRSNLLPSSSTHSSAKNSSASPDLDSSHVDPSASAQSSATGTRADGSSPQPASHTSSRPPTSSLLNPRVFASLEQNLVEMVETAAAMDHEWHDVAGDDASGAPFAAACSWLQSRFPVLHDVEATRLAFQRAAHGSDAFTHACRDTDGRLPRQDFADFLIRALYCHKSPPTCRCCPARAHSAFCRVCATCEEAWSSALRQLVQPGDAEISEDAFIDAGKRMLSVSQRPNIGTHPSQRPNSAYREVQGQLEMFTGSWASTRAAAGAHRLASLPRRLLCIFIIRVESHVLFRVPCPSSSCAIGSSTTILTDSPFLPPTTPHPLLLLRLPHRALHRRWHRQAATIVQAPQIPQLFKFRTQFLYLQTWLLPLQHPGMTLILP